MVKCLIFTIIISAGCKSDLQYSSSKKSYPNVIGDITFDPNIDGEFKRCDSYTNQYYSNGGIGYKGEMSMIKKQIEDNYTVSNQEGQSGFVTIRFVVNCHGISGMYRVHQTDLLLTEFKFSSEIVDQLLNAMKNLKGWERAEFNGNFYDYYQYLTFKLINGKIVEIAP